MHRLLVEPSLLTQEKPALPKEALGHLRVLRPKCGEEIELFDGSGHTRQFVWREGVLSAQADIQSFARSDVRLTLFACVTKGSRWDWTIEKATELGVTCIVPIISDRTIVRIAPSERTAKRARWQRIAEDAARQSDAKWLPEILAPLDFADSLTLVRETTCFVGALTSPPSPPLLEAVRRTSVSQSVSLSTFIGPEGDFTAAELAALHEIAIPTCFGPTILRAETAAIFALSVLAAARAEISSQGEK